jgi:Protein of unknown function (DUF295)/F-box domain
MSANWSELVPDFLEVITSYLSLSDVNRFSAVCKHWRSIAKQRRHAPVPQLPWLVLTENPETGKRKLYNMSERRHYHIDLPELHGGYCVGSSFGWLFVVSPKIEGYLVNPFTGAHYLFPPLSLLIQNLKLDQAVDGKITYEKHGILYTWKLKKIQELIISKAVLSDDPNKCENFVIMIIVHGLYKMAFCRPKDSEWTIVSDYRFVNDVICYKGNFYAVEECNVLYAVDLGPEPKMQRIEPWVAVCHYNEMNESRYLVDYFGKHLLLVYRHKIEENDDDRSTCHSVTDFFAVFELDLERKKWRVWNDLRGNAIFVGTNRAIAVHASELPDCKANCIYFSSCSTDVCASNNYGYDDHGVYNLIEDKIEKFYEDHIPNTSMPTWLVPNLN